MCISSLPFTMTQTCSNTASVFLYGAPALRKQAVLQERASLAARVRVKECGHLGATCRLERTRPDHVRRSKRTVPCDRKNTQSRSPFGSEISDRQVHAVKRRRYHFSTVWWRGRSEGTGGASPICGPWGSTPPPRAGEGSGAAVPACPPGSAPSAPGPRAAFWKGAPLRLPRDCSHGRLHPSIELRWVIPHYPFCGPAPSGPEPRSLRTRSPRRPTPRPPQRSPRPSGGQPAIRGHSVRKQLHQDS